MCHTVQIVAVVMYLVFIHIDNKAENTNPDRLKTQRESDK